MEKIKIIKKNGIYENFDSDKIIKAVKKAAERVDTLLTDEEYNIIVNGVVSYLYDNFQLNNEVVIGVYDLHPIVEQVTENINKKVAKSYRDYRNYKKENNEMMERILKEVETLNIEGDKSNANADSRLITTKRFLEGSALSKTSYQKFFLSKKENQANNDGYIYIHDLSQRKYTFNCCIFNMAEVFKNGFTMGSINYTEPKTLSSAFNLLGDVILSASSQQYGGFTVPEVDKLLKPYALKSFEKYKKEFYLFVDDNLTEETKNKSIKYAYQKVKEDFKQGFQGIECMLNSCANAKGDYSFVSFTFGLGSDEFERMASEICLEVRKEGQGCPGFKKPVLFPKLIFLYDEELHTKDKPLYNLFLQAIECSKKCLYPDYFNVRQVEEETTRNYIKYGTPISPMGCRSIVSPFYESGNFEQQNENDLPVTVGRFNIGVVSLNLIMIYMKALETKKDFYKVLDEYLEIIRGIHKKTREQLSKLKASAYPLAFMEGGLWHGHLQADDTIEPCLKAATASFGITGLNELQQLHNQKSLVEDGEFALEVSKYIFEKLKEFKKEDGIAYAIYGTPAESLSGKQVQQFRKKYGVIPNVSDREYLSNSFHCHVSEEISPIQKQLLEQRFWPYFSGGRIMYNRYYNDTNTKAFEILITEAMKKGYYYGVNLAKTYCEDCGHEFLDVAENCPNCNSINLTKIDRVCGYLGFSKINGSTRMNDSKMAEIKERKSM